MSFKNSIYNQLKIKLDRKNILILKGNVKDIVIPSTLGIEFKKQEGKISSCSFPEYLSLLLNELDYKNISWFSPYLGKLIAENGLFNPENEKNHSAMNQKAHQNILMMILMMI
ncbi:hypothetical protein [Mycoplasmopsis adleri]|uniref:hypothetical protein n=1 Tax=Mycoplasmopsis adleri TaxID=51362 RepID=UPI003873C084